MSRVWTKFKDSHAGGYLKIDKTEAIFIEAPQDEAINVFYNRFGVNPNQVSCTCCGDDYTIYETDESEIDDLGTYPAIVIKTYDIAPHEREGQVPVSGYVWKSGEDSGKRTIEQIAQAWENMGRKNKNLGGVEMEEKTFATVKEEAEFLLSGRGKYLVARALLLLEEELDNVKIDFMKEHSDLEDVRYLLKSDLLTASVGAVAVAESFKIQHIDKWLKT